MPQLVSPHGRGRFDTGDDHVAECDRAEAASRQDEVGKAAIAHVEKAAVPTPGPGERQETQKVPDRIGVVRDEGSADGQGMVATRSSTAATTRARVVNDESKWMVMSLSLRSTATEATPSIWRQPAMMCS